MGDFYIPEEAMELQKNFCQNARIINEQQTEAMRSEVRDRVIELVEKLPESMLDEAIKVLESSSRRIISSSDRFSVLAERQLMSA